MSDNKIFVTGIGVISAIGNNVEQNYESLKNKRSGIGDIEILQTDHKGKFKVGEIKHSNAELIQILGLPNSIERSMTRTALLGLVAAREAVESSGIDLNDGYKTGLISATTVGGMDRTENEISNSNASTDFIHTHPCGDSTNKIAQHLGISDYRTTISTACSSGINAIIHAVRLMNAGIIDRAIVGGIDALSKFTLNGFNSLMILDKNYCKPFDENRMGLNLGEAAGFLVIESEKTLKDRTPLCCVAGFANANDAYHQTASSPEGNGAYTAMKESLEMSGLQASDIDYVNAHGTATPNNDLSEGIALKRLFGEEVPKFSSTKGFTGHTLGAAGGVEAVFSVMAIQNNMVYPNLNFTTVISEIDLVPQLEVEEMEVNNVLSNSFGFGGNNSSVIFSK